MAKKRRKVRKTKPASKPTAEKNDETPFARERFLQALYEVNKIAKDVDTQRAQDLAADIASELLQNQSCRAMFEKSCQAFHNGYRACYEGYADATVKDRELFHRMTEGGAPKGEQSLARDYVLLAGIHD